MWGFLLGLIIGIGAKSVYDLFKDEQLPAPIGLNAGRVESMLDETRQAVRDLREELRRAMSGEGSLQEKAGRVLGAAAESVGASRGEGSQGGSGGTEAGSRSSSEGEGLMLTANEPSSSASGAGGSPAASSGLGGTSGPTSTHGTMQTMS